MVSAVRVLAAATTTTTTAGSGLTAPTSLLPGASSTTTVAGVPATTTTLAQSATTLAHSAATTTTVAVAGSNASNNDRGVIHQLWIEAGSSPKSAHTAQIYLAPLLKVLVILVVAFVLSRVVGRLSKRMVNGLRLVSPLVQATPRGAARVQTLGGAFTSIFRAVIWIIAGLEILNELSINLAPFIAGATVIGAALGFGAQSLVKDFLSGILILAEDQYGVGDHIAIGTAGSMTSGTVESVNLRVTRLRGADGGILYVPNGEIRTLSNDTETDSQALVDVVLPYGTDLVAAGVAAQEAAREMADDPEWRSEFVSEPYFAGVQDATSANGVTVRIMALTRPGQHLRMAREMRLRIMERLRSNRIAWAPPDGDGVVTPPAEEVRRARAEKRAAERQTAERLGRVPPTTAKRTGRIGRRRQDTPPASETPTGTGTQPGGQAPPAGESLPDAPEGDGA